jgi:Fe-S-cluster containining protein
MIRLPIAPIDPNAIPVHSNCARCTALCCHYVSTEIDAPTSRRDFDVIRWYLMHPGVRVYCEELNGSWFVQFMSRCSNLLPDNRCGIYETRPQICRDLDANECEFALGAGDRWLFTNLQEFERWAAERARQKNARRAARAVPTVKSVRSVRAARKNGKKTTRKSVRKLPSRR